MAAAGIAEGMPYGQLREEAVGEVGSRTGSKPSRLVAICRVSCDGWRRGRASFTDLSYEKRLLNDK